MSDVDMDTSPRSSAASDIEKPPTPDYEDEDGDEQLHDDNFDEDEAIEKDEKEQDSVKSKSPNESENDDSDEDVGDGSVSRQGSSLDENEIQENASVPQSDFVNVEGSSPVTPSSARDESPEHQISNELEDDDFKRDNGGNVEKSDDTTLPEVVENNNEVEGDAVMSEVQESVNKEQDHTKEKDPVDGSLHDNESFAKASASSGNVDDGDLLQISDLSVDLTGDEAAIVEDILQNAGDGELIPSGNTAEAKPLLEDQKEMPDSAKEASAELAKEQQHNQQEEQGGGTGELFADIFGSSDEDEEFQGFEKEELQGSSRSRKKLSKEKHKRKPVITSDEEDEPTKTEEVEAEAEAKVEVEVEEPKESLVVPAPASESSGSDDEDIQSQHFISDFDLMMQQKKEENRKVRRRKNVDIINDSDDMVVGLIKRMQQAAQEDRLANEARQAATKKLILLPSVMKHMLKVDLMVVFLDCNVLPVLKDWIMPLPDGSLPHLQVREGVLKILKELPTVDSGALKVSGIGKAVMYLFRHPKEIRKNKECAGKLISEWSRPIFGVTANFKSMTREEREERDYVNMTKRRRLSNDDRAGGKTPKEMESTINTASKGLRPGEKGWCMRARVPTASNKDYVVRPKSDIEFVDFSKTSKKTLNRFEQQKRKFNEKKGSTSKQRAVEISLEGRKMTL